MTRSFNLWQVAIFSDKMLCFLLVDESRRILIIWSVVTHLLYRLGYGKVKVVYKWTWASLKLWRVLKAR